MNTKQKKLSIALISIMVTGGLITSGVLYYNNIQEQNAALAAQKLRQAEMRIPKAPEHINIRPNIDKNRNINQETSKNRPTKYRKILPSLSNYVKEMVKKDKSLTEKQKQLLIKDADNYNAYENLQNNNNLYVEKIDQMGKRIKLMTIQDQLLRQQGTLAKTRIDTLEQNNKLEAVMEKYQPKQNINPMQSASVSMIASTNHGYVAKLNINKKNITIKKGDRIDDNIKVISIKPRTVTLLNTSNHQIRILSV